MANKEHIQRLVTILLPDVRIASLPGPWEKAPGDRGGWKIDIQGKDFGGYGHRRIVVRAPKNLRWLVGDHVQARAMRTTKSFKDKSITYNYLALDRVSRNHHRVHYGCPTLSWNIIETDISLKLNHRIKWINNSYWFQTIDSTNKETGKYTLGILAITDKYNTFSVVDRNTDEEIFVIDNE